MTHEGKFDPTVEDMTIDRKDLTDLVRNLVRRVHQDSLDRENWLSKQAHFYRRRYAREFRGTDWPWPGATDIVPPMIDMMIERVKPIFLQSVLSPRPIATVLSLSSSTDSDRVHRVENFLEWQMHHRDKKFPWELAYNVDYLLQFGHSVWRIDYSYVTRRRRDVILRDRLPDRIRQATQVLVEGAGAEQGSLDTMLGSLGLSKKEISTLLPEELLSDLVRTHFRLHPDDPDDREAIGRIVSWIRSSNEKSVVVSMREIVSDHPVCVSPPPERLIVPPWTTDIDRAPRITEELFFHEDEVEQFARDQRWIANSVDRVLEKGRASNSGRSPSRPTEGLTMDLAREEAHDDLSQRIGRTQTTEGDEVLRFWRIYTHLELRSGKQPEKVRLTVHPETAEIVQAVVLPTAEWPFVKANFEYSDRAFYRTRGLPEKLNDIDVEFMTQERQKLNAMTITNSPTLLWRTQSLLDPEILRWVPGAVIPVTRPDDLTELRLSQRDISFDREMQILQSMAERYTGTLDSAITEQGNLTRPRTRGEVEAIQGIQSQVIGPRLLLYQHAMMQVYRKVFHLWMRFGPPEAWVQVTGKPIPVRLTRAELEGEYDFIPTPSALSNPSTRIQEAKIVVDTVISILQQPEALEEIRGKYEFNWPEALRDFLDEVNWRRAEQILRRLTPEEQAAFAQSRQQASSPTAIPVEGDARAVGNRIRQARGLAESGEIPSEFFPVKGGA